MTSHLNQPANKRLDDWLRRALAPDQPGGVAHDIHVDEIDTTLRDRSRWVIGGIEVFRAALSNDQIPQTDWLLCLVFYLEPDTDTTALSANRPEEWTDKLGITPPELVLARADVRARYEQYLQKSGTELGSILVSGAKSMVYVTDRHDHYGDVVDHVRLIWITVTKAADDC